MNYGHSSRILLFRGSDDSSRTSDSYTAHMRDAFQDKYSIEVYSCIQRSPNTEAATEINRLYGIRNEDLILWIGVFTSSSAAQSLVKLHKQGYITDPVMSWMQQLNFYAVGDATRKEATAGGFIYTFSPNKSDAVPVNTAQGLSSFIYNDVMRILSSQQGGESSTNSVSRIQCNVLYFCGDNAEGMFHSALLDASKELVCMASAEFAVHQIVVYKADYITPVPRHHHTSMGPNEVIILVFFSSRIATLIMTSESWLTFFHVFEKGRIKLVAIGPTTAQHCTNKLKLTIDATASIPSPYGVVSAIRTILSEP